MTTRASTQSSFIQPRSSSSNANTKQIHTALCVRRRFRAVSTNRRADPSLNVRAHAVMWCSIASSRAQAQRAQQSKAEQHGQSLHREPLLARSSANTLSLSCSIKHIRTHTNTHLIVVSRHEHCDREAAAARGHARNDDLDARDGHHGPQDWERTARDCGVAHVQQDRDPAADQPSGLHVPVPRVPQRDRGASSSSSLSVFFRCSRLLPCAHTLASVRSMSRGLLSLPRAHASQKLQGDDLLIVADPLEVYGENWLVCLTRKAYEAQVELLTQRERERLDELAAQAKAASGDNGDDDLASIVYEDRPMLARAWVSSSTKETRDEVDALSIVSSRPLVRRRRVLCFVWRVYDMCCVWCMMCVCCGASHTRCRCLSCSRAATPHAHAHSHAHAHALGRSSATALRRSSCR